MEHEAALRPIDESGIRTVQELTARLSKLFECVDGPKRAYFDVPSGLRLDSGGEIVARVIYEVAAFSVISEFVEQAEPVLCQAFWNFIKGLPYEEDNILFWRSQPSLTADRLSLGVDAEGRSEEVCEDSGVQFIDTYGPQQVTLRARLAILGVKASNKEEGLVAKLIVP